LRSNLFILIYLFLEKCKKQSNIEKLISFTEILGKGSFGEVYSATLFQKNIAIKKISVWDELTVEECEIHMRLRHLNIGL
jgi:hypothetical protein